MLELSLHITIHTDHIDARIDPAALGTRLGMEKLPFDAATIALAIPTLIVRRGTDVKLTIRFDAPAQPSRRDPKLVELIVKAHQARRLLGLDGKPPTIAPDMEYQARNHIARLARLAFLAPEITTAIFEGSQPAGLSVRKLLRTSDLPMDWTQQKHMLGFGWPPAAAHRKGGASAPPFLLVVQKVCPGQSQCQ